MLPNIIFVHFIIRVYPWVYHKWIIILWINIPDKNIIKWLRRVIEIFHEDNEL